MNRPALVMCGVAFVTIFNCSGQTCVTSLPSGFPSAERVGNATQTRLTQTALAKLAADPESIATQLFGSGPVSPTPSCGGSTPMCCPGGVPLSPCGPINFDVEQRPGDLPRVELRPAESASRLDVTVRARLTTQNDIPISIPIAGDCGLRIDTSGGPIDDVQISVPVRFVQDADAGTTRLEPGTVIITNLTGDDVALTGSFTCELSTLGVSFFLDLLTGHIATSFANNINTALCKRCPSGDVAECGPLASACVDAVCMNSTGNQCLQELGLTGRLSSAALFGGSPPARGGAVDLYEVAGGYATSNDNGLALGVLGGALPGGAPRDRCGPAAPAPTPETVPVSTFFQGNTRPDTGQQFDFGIGFHRSHVEHFVYAAYEGGVMCPTLGTSELPALSIGTLDGGLPSLRSLTGESTALTVALRPQAPPGVVLGPNTFDLDGGVESPLIELTFDGVQLERATPPSSGWAALACVAIAALWLARRRLPRELPAALLLLAVLTLGSCSECGMPPNTNDGGVGGGDATGGGGNVSGGGGGDDGGGGGGVASPCGASACLPGEVQRGTLGQWNSVAVDGTRVVIASYDALLGDVVLLERQPDGGSSYRAVDGVPASSPTYEPATYRGGVAEAGPDVGAWTSVKLSNARVIVTYQDRGRRSLRVALEDESGAFSSYELDGPEVPGVELGAYASLAVGAAPSVAYLATGLQEPLDDGGTTTRSELRLATANTAAPAVQADWTTTVVASSTGPGGPGQHVTLLVRSDGRRVLVHYDTARQLLLAHVENAAGSATFTEVVLDGALQRGRWACAVLGTGDAVHVGYTDDVGQQVFFLTLDEGGVVSIPEVVDDGVRDNRTHPVGAGLTLWLDGTSPRLAYQDGLTADVVVATKGTTWSHADLATGAALDGFHLAAPERGPGPLVWDRVNAGAHQLVIRDVP